MSIVSLYVKHHNVASLCLDEAACHTHLPAVNAVLNGGSELELQIDNETGRILNWTPIVTNGKKFVLLRPDDDSAVDEEADEEDEADGDAQPYVSPDNPTEPLIGTHEIWAKNPDWQKVGDSATLAEALEIIAALAGEAVFGIKYPNGQWHQF